MWTRRAHVLNPLTEAASIPRGIKLPWNDDIEEYFNELKHMVSFDTLLNCTYWEVSFDVHKNASD